MRLFSFFSHRRAAEHFLPPVPDCNWTLDYQSCHHLLYYTYTFTHEYTMGMDSWVVGQLAFWYTVREVREKF